MTKKNKKPLNSYKKALQIVLNESSIANTFGGARPTTGASTDNPKGFNAHKSTPNLGNTMTGPNGWDIELINNEEELTSRAPTLLPFPLDTIFEYVVDAVSALQKVDSQMKSAIDSNVTLSKAKIIRLKEMQQYVSDNIEDLVELGKKLESFNIDEI